LVSPSVIEVKSIYEPAAKSWPKKPLTAKTKL
jgi:hypothetical protein